MVVALSIPIKTSEVLAAVSTWVDYLVAKDYQAAYGFTEHDTYHQWTPALIESIIAGYGLPYEDGAERFEETDPAMATGKPHYREVMLYNSQHPGPHGSLGELWIDLPLNGHWSDLTATFQIIPFEAGATLVLDEIHVF